MTSPVSADMLVVQARRAGEGACERIAAAVAVLSLPVHARLSDHQHSTVVGLIDGFIASVEMQLREFLVNDDEDLPFPPDAEALIGGQELLAAPLLAQVGMTRDPVLVAAALRRADAHHIATARSASAVPDPVDRLRDSPDRAIAEAATALSIAEHRRLGQFQEPLLIADDLSVELVRRIVWRVAASLRRALLWRRRSSNAIAMFDCTVVRLLEGHDASAAVESRAMLLMHRLHATGAIYDDLIAAAAGDELVAIAALAVRAGLDYTEVADIITDPAQTGLTVLLRAIDVYDDRSAAILLSTDHRHSGRDDPNDG